MSLVFFIFYWQILILQAITILSWRLNSNKCLITQLEDYIFGETIIDTYFYIIGQKTSYKKYIVPSYQRYLLYFCFIFGIIYHFLI